MWLAAALLLSPQPASALPRWQSAPVAARPRLAGTATDPDSYARPLEARVVDVALDLTVDFDARRLAGVARLTVTRAPGARRIILDTHDLEIQSITGADGRALVFSLGTNDPVHGQPLTVDLPSTDTLVIRYSTTPRSAALQWLPPAQTAGNAHPYLFTQGEAILTRAWVPTQDSPGIRQTYSARIVVPRGLVAVMAAEAEPAGGIDVPGGRAFSFRMDHAIPPYLFALAVGDIAFRPLGTRTGVYADPAVLDAAAWEFADIEKMLAAAEALYGPYRWGRYDILVLPPSFPYGGMENPRLTFISPTVIAGDRSLTSVAAHELAHSWSGNLVTNATWADMWLNEGVTTYIEQRIVEQLYGRDAAAAVEAVEREELLALMARGARVDPAARDRPLESERGGERGVRQGIGVPSGHRAGGRPRAIRSMAARVLRQARVHVDHDGAVCRRSACRRCSARTRRASSGSCTWTNGCTEPVSRPTHRCRPPRRSIERGTRLHVSWRAHRPSSLQTTGWSTQQWLHFLAALPGSLSRAQLEDLDRAAGLSGRQNAEVLAAWLQVALAREFEPVVPVAERFLTSQGRLKFLEEVYGALMTTAWGRPIASRIYRQARPLYHPVAQTGSTGLDRAGGRGRVHATG